MSGDVPSPHPSSVSTPEPSTLPIHDTYSWHATDAAIKVYLKEMRFPPNFKVEKQPRALDHDRHQLLITAHWPDIDNFHGYHVGYDYIQYKARTAGTYNLIVLDEYVLYHAKDFGVYLDNMIYRSMTELWMHELHEWHLDHTGNHFHNPHPQGRSGPLG